MKSPSSSEYKSDLYLENKSTQQNLPKTFQTYERGRKQADERIEHARLLAQIEQHLKYPVDVELGDSPSKGPKDAKIIIVEFSDFQCRFCKKGHGMMEDLLSEYPKEIRLVSKNLPLAFHREARAAAKAALAAGKQGKFWEMHAALFEEQGHLGGAVYKDEAARLNLDLERFLRDMNSREIESEIRSDEVLARHHGIRGTPGFLVNGIPVRGAKPVSYFRVIVDRLLKEVN